MKPNPQFNIYHVRIFINPLTECSEIPGAWCGDPLFDTCNGDWDYGIDCDPFLDVCCIPDTVATTTEATDLPTNQTTTAWPTSKPGGILPIDLWM